MRGVINYSTCGHNVKNLFTYSIVYLTYGQGLSEPLFETQCSSLAESNVPICAS